MLAPLSRWRRPSILRSRGHRHTATATVAPNLSRTQFGQPDRRRVRRASDPRVGERPPATHHFRLFVPPRLFTFGSEREKGSPREYVCGLSVSVERRRVAPLGTARFHFPTSGGLWQSVLSVDACKALLINKLLVQDGAVASSALHALRKRGRAISLSVTANRDCQG